MKFYTYVILFEDKTFYIGARKCPPECTPFTDFYFGSPVTHKEKWKTKEFRKRVLSIHETEEEVISAEISLLNKVSWKENPRCLNENNAGMFSSRVCSEAGKSGGRATAQRIKEDPDLAARRSSRLSESLKKRYAENPIIHERQIEFALTASKVGVARAAEKRLANPEFYDQVHKKISESHVNRIQNDQEYREAQLNKLLLARAAYDSKIENDAEFKNKVLEIRKKFSESTRGTIWITNGSTNKRVNPDSVIPEGYRKGRTTKKRHQ